MFQMWCETHVDIYNLTLPTFAHPLQVEFIFMAI